MIDCVIGSPPFSEPGSQPPNIRVRCPVRSRWKDEPDREDNYGQTEGQLGSMPFGCPPPFARNGINDETANAMPQAAAHAADGMEKLLRR